MGEFRAKPIVTVVGSNPLRIQWYFVGWDLWNLTTSKLTLISSAEQVYNLFQSLFTYIFCFDWCFATSFHVDLNTFSADLFPEPNDIVHNDNQFGIKPFRIIKLTFLSIKALSHAKWFFVCQMFHSPSIRPWKTLEKVLAKIR